MTPLPLRVLLALLAIALLLGITSCHPAREDFEDCLAGMRQDATLHVSAFSEPERVDACMESRGWRPMRPHSEPGPSGWARTR